MNNSISKSFWIIEIHRLATFLGPNFIRRSIGEGLMDFRSFTSVHTLAIQVLYSIRGPGLASIYNEKNEARLIRLLSKHFTTGSQVKVSQAEDDADTLIVKEAISLPRGTKKQVVIVGRVPTYIERV